MNNYESFESKFKVNTETPYEENIQKLKEIFPSIFEDGKINYNKLREAVEKPSDTESNEKNTEPYGLFWAEKSKVIKEYHKYNNTAFSFKANEQRSVNFNTTENIIIEGDNLHSLALLKEAYKGKVKMIYIDPPYNTGNCFIYEDNFSETPEEYKKRNNLIDENGLATQSNINDKINGRFHSKWLSMMYSRLKLARDLLRDDGVIFVSIDDNEQANLKLLMDEVFGEENFVCNMPRKTKPSVTTKSKAELQTLHDYTLVYWKNKKQSSFNLKHIGIKEYLLEDDRGKFYILPLQDNGPHGTKTARPNLHYTIYQNPNGELSLEKKDGSIELLPKKHKNDDGRWMWSKKKFQKDINDLYVKDNKVYIKHYYDGNEDQNKYQTEKTWLDQFPNRLGSTTLSELGLKNIMSYPKPIEMIKFFITISTQDNDIILDFFAGSGTTGHAVMEINLENKKKAIENGEDPTLVGNRKYIMVQLPEIIDEKTYAYKEGYKKISDITIERIKRAGNKISEENPDIDLDVGFKVFALTESNFKSIGKDTEEDKLPKQQELWREGIIKENKTNKDIVYELLLRKGFQLNENIINNDDYAFAEFSNENNYYIVVLYNNITQAIVKKIIERIDSETALCTHLLIKEKGFTNNDLAKMNLHHTIKQLDIKVKIEYL